LASVTDPTKKKPFKVEWKNKTLYLDGRRTVRFAEGHGSRAVYRAGKYIIKVGHQCKEEWEKWCKIEQRDRHYFAPIYAFGYYNGGGGRWGGGNAKHEYIVQHVVHKRPSTAKRDEAAAKLAQSLFDHYSLSDFHDDNWCIDRYRRVKIFDLGI
jgi:hypothetical protein